MFQNIIKLFWHGMNLKICDSLAVTVFVAQNETLMDLVQPLSHFPFSAVGRQKLLNQFLLGWILQLGQIVIA